MAGEQNTSLGGKFITGTEAFLHATADFAVANAPSVDQAIEAIELTGKYALGPIGFAASVAYGAASGSNDGALGAIKGALTEGFNFSASWVAGETTFDILVGPLGASFNVPGVVGAGLIATAVGISTGIALPWLENSFTTPAGKSNDNGVTSFEAGPSTADTLFSPTVTDASGPFGTNGTFSNAPNSQPLYNSESFQAGSATDFGAGAEPIPYVSQNQDVFSGIGDGLSLDLSSLSVTPGSSDSGLSSSAFVIGAETVPYLDLNQQLSSGYGGSTDTGLTDTSSSFLSLPAYYDPESGSQLNLNYVNVDGVWEPYYAPNSDSLGGASGSSLNSTSDQYYFDDGSGLDAYAYAMPTSSDNGGSSSWDKTGYGSVGASGYDFGGSYGGGFYGGGSYGGGFYGGGSYGGSYGGGFYGGGYAFAPVILDLTGRGIQVTRAVPAPSLFVTTHYARPTNLCARKAFAHETARIV